MNNENKPKPHPHAELIKLWAEGAEIQHFDTSAMQWNDCKEPNWFIQSQYRIKPESNEPWKPKKGEQYFFVLIHVVYKDLIEISHSFWENDALDKKLYDIGNCFRTVEEAKAAIPRMERALKNLYAISDKKAHDLECELYDKIDRLTKYPEIDGKPLTEGEIALIKALRISKIHYVCESATVAIEGHNDINGAKLVQNAFSFVPASKHHYAELSVAIKQIKAEQESTK